MPEEFKVGDYAVVRGATRYEDRWWYSIDWPPTTSFGNSFDYAQASLGKIVCIDHLLWARVNLRLLVALFHPEKHGVSEHTNFSLFRDQELIKINPENLRQEIVRLKEHIWIIKNRNLDELVEIYRGGLEQLDGMSLKDIETHKQGVELLRADMPNMYEHKAAQRLFEQHRKEQRAYEDWLGESSRSDGWIGASMIA